MAWEYPRIGEFHRTRSHPDARQGTRSTAHRTAKDRTEMAVDAVVNKKRAARKAFSSGLDINAGAEEYERKQREEIIQALSACKGRVGGTYGAAIRLGISRTTLIYRMRRLGIYAKLYS
jgi:transcriptional regulator of acetoin/glycerol metabolism